MDDNEKLRARVIETIRSMVKTMLIRTWAELVYRRDVIMIRATKCSSIEVDYKACIHYLGCGIILKRLHLNFFSYHVKKF